MNPLPTELCAPTLVVLPWRDPVVESVGHPLQGEYVELFWLGVLGPTATWLLRRLDAGLLAYPDGFELDLAETAAALGLTFTPGRSGPFTRSVHRLVMFGLAQPLHSGLAVRRSVPPLAQRQLQRLPPHLQQAHGAWATTAPEPAA